ncbi:hypothetical protein JW964_07580 [candidate division KSB1 bacterium]|nr:hypothetical protein [candidate division KSB1 bacterium]
MGRMTPDTIVPHARHLSKKINFQLLPRLAQAQMSIDWHLVQHLVT